MSHLTRKDKELVMEAIAEAEKKTSGEIRVHVESRVKGDPLDRAVEVFFELGMNETAEKNGVLFYLALVDQKFAVLGDEGIDQRTPSDFWERIKETMAVEFRAGRFTDGFCRGIQMAGEALASYFPYQSGDINELTDEISEGD